MMEARHTGNIRRSGAGEALRLKVPPHPRSGRFVRDRVTAFARRHAIPDADAAEFVLALGEALANAFEHAQSVEPIEANCWIVGRDALVAAVVDAGTGLATRSEARESDSAEPPDVLADRGRGFSIMRRCTDGVAVRSIPGRGTAVILVRYVRHGRGGRGSR